jgi:hypothetical protein
VEAARDLLLPSTVQPASSEALLLALRALSDEGVQRRLAALQLIALVVDEQAAKLTEPPELLSAFLADSGVQALVAAHNRDAAEEAASACSALAALSRFQPLLPAAGEAGAVEACVRSLHRHPRDAAVAAACSSSLRNLLSLPANKPRGTAAGVSSALVSALRSHAGDLAVLRAASGALNNAAAGDEAGKQAALAANALPSLLAALQEQRRDAVLAEQACGAIAVLATAGGGEGAELAASLGAVVETRKALDAHLGLKTPSANSGRAKRPGSPKVAAACSRALASLAWRSEAIQRSARDAEADASLKLAQAQFPGDEQVAKWAAKALEKIVDPALELMFGGMFDEYEKRKGKGKRGKKTEL